VAKVAKERRIRRRARLARKREIAEIMALLDNPRVSPRRRTLVEVATRDMPGDVKLDYLRWYWQA